MTHKIPINGEVVSDESELRALCGYLHLSDPLPDHEPDRYDRAAELFGSVMGSGKTQGLVGIYNREDVERAKLNAQRLSWAKEKTDEIIRDADFWASFSDETLYAMVPTQNPMSLTVCPYYGCPIHGGNRSTFECDMLRPYQWRCNLGGEWWYNGIEIENPGTGETLRMTDDGPGWVAPDGFPNPGETYYFAGAYSCFLLYRLFSEPYAPQTGEGHQGRGAALCMALAYALTGERKYARKTGILLNRLAEVYGRLRGTKEGDEGFEKGKDPIRGYAGEASGREQQFIDKVVLTYDLTFDAIREDESIPAFFQERGCADYDGDGEVGPRDVVHNIHRNLFGYVYEFLDRTIPIAGGDFLTASLNSLVKLGVCIHNGAMIKRAFEAPTGIHNVMANSFFRDGKFSYDSISYGMLNIREVLLIAEWCQGFQDGTNFKRPLDIYTDSRFRLKEMMAFSRAVDCYGRNPMIGDTTTSRERVLESTYSLDDEIGLLRLPDERDTYARRILAGTDGDPESARKSGDDFLLFHAEPWDSGEYLQSDRAESVALHDSGFCVLRAGDDKEHQRHLALNYGKGSAAHGHWDKLAVNLIAYGYDLSADLGYPPSWIAPKRNAWEYHTASHCTALIDGENQEFATGSLNLFVDGPWVRLADASGDRAYPALAKIYRRAVALIPLDGERSYAVDLFRVAGGKTHDYSFHSLAGDDGSRLELSLPDGLKMTDQVGGTLAGPDVPFGESPGYGWIKDISRVDAAGKISATWRAEDRGPGIRLHMLGEEGSTVFTGLGEGHGLKGQSPWDPYVIVRRSGEGEKENRFISVLEPFSEQPFLTGVDPILVNGRTVGVKVRSGEITHYIVRGEDGNDLVQVELDGEQLRLKGDWAFVERTGDAITKAQVVNGVEFRYGDVVFHGAGEPGGMVDSVDADGRSIVVSCSVPLPVDGSLEGHTVVIENERYICNSTYEITGVQEAGEGKYRLLLENMDFLLSEGTAKEINDAALLTDTPMVKLGVANLFDGKVISHTRGETGSRLTTAEKGKLTLEDSGDAAAFKGKPFYVYDVGPGDKWRIPVCWYSGS